MRTLVIGDIHGGLRALHQILERAKVTTKDTLIFLGDYVDGWSQSPQVLDFIIDLKPNKTAFAFVAITTIYYWNGLKVKTICCGTNGGEATVLAEPLV
jgi:serine/threonine protein phosphatase 1